MSKSMVHTYSSVKKKTWQRTTQNNWSFTRKNKPKFVVFIRAIVVHKNHLSKTHKKSLGSTLRMYLIVCNNNRKNIELEIKFCQKLFLCVLYFDVYIEGFVCTTFLMQTDNSYRKIPPIKHHVHFIISILKTYYFKRRFRRNRNTIIKKMESFPTLYS